MRIQLGVLIDAVSTLVLAISLKSINLKTKISQGPIECSFIISDDERESNEFTQIYTIGEIFEADCMNDDIHVIGSVAIRSSDRNKGLLQMDV